MAKKIHNLQNKEAMQGRAQNKMNLELELPFIYSSSH